MAAEDFLEQKVALPSVVRVALAVVVMLGGLLFALLGVLMLFRKPPVPPPSPTGTWLLGAFIALVGAGIFWIGLRLVRARSSSHSLLPPVARACCSLVLAVMAVAMLVAAARAASVTYLITALGLAVPACWLFPRVRR